MRFELGLKLRWGSGWTMISEVGICRATYYRDCPGQPWGFSAMTASVRARVKTLMEGLRIATYHLQLNSSSIKPKTFRYISLAGMALGSVD